jgi:hypothetical protein
VQHTALTSLDADLKKKTCCYYISGSGQNQTQDSLNTTPVCQPYLPFVLVATVGIQPGTSGILEPWTFCIVG